MVKPFLGELKSWNVKTAHLRSRADSVYSSEEDRCLACLESGALLAEVRHRQSDFQSAIKGGRRVTGGMTSRPTFSDWSTSCRTPPQRARGELSVRLPDIEIAALGAHRRRCGHARGIAAWLALVAASSWRVVDFNSCRLSRSGSNAPGAGDAERRGT